MKDVEGKRKKEEWKRDRWEEEERKNENIN